MKRALTLAAALFMVMAVTASASAEMVNIGLIEMEKADLVRIQGLVSGSQSFENKTPVARKQAEVDTGPVKMSAADLSAIQDYVAGRTEFKTGAGNVSGENMVNIGLLEMAESDLFAMEKMFRQGHEYRLAQIKSALNN
ncbi:MAG: hypothetical protein GY697_01395 [Desulfobacterales bacterium]|nr:hypothetical protein [Desulfobacterales bacterium]